MKNKKGFKRLEVLVIDLHQMNKEFQDIFYATEDCKHDWNEYHSEFTPFGKQDYSDTFTKDGIEKYWKDQIKTNNYTGSLKEFIEDYGLEMDAWFINCGYDFSGVKKIIIDAG